MKNITQKIPPIIVVKVAFSSCVLPTNETDAYPPISTIGTSHFEIAIEFLKFTILKALARAYRIYHVLVLAKAFQQISTTRKNT